MEYFNGKMNFMGKRMYLDEYKNPFGRLACMCIETGERFYSR